MATEIDIPESVLLKEVKIEDNAFSSESLEEKVRESVDNKVKQLEASNVVAEPVNTKLETGIMTNGSETFFQTLSVPTVTADEHSNIPETSKETPKQEDQEEIKVTKIEALTDEKPVDDVVEAVSTQTEREVETIGNEDKNDGKAIQIDEETQEKDQALNTLVKDQVADSNEQDLNEMPSEFVKEETKDISNDAQEASEQCENGPDEEREQKPEESVKNIVLSTAEIKQEEKTNEFPGVEIEEELKQNGLLHEKKGEEVTQSDDGQKENSENPSITEVREENSSEKIEYKSSTPIAIVNKDEAEKKEQDVNVLEKDLVKDGVAGIQDMMPEGGLEETKHQGDCNEAEVKAKESMEKETEEIIYSVGTPENIQPQNLNNVIPTDVSITAHKKPEETMKNEEQNDVEAIDTEDGKTKDSGSSMVKEIYEEPVSDKANTEEGLRPSESSNKETIENDIVSKDEGQEKNDIECSQDEPSTGDLEEKTNETITNDEKATEKEASDETGPENAVSEVGLKVSGSMEPTKVEALSTIEKNQGDSDGVLSSQDATCEDIKETKSGEKETTVADTEELNETPREFKEEAEGKSIDSEANYHSENKAEEKLVERPDESLNKIEQKEETEDIRPSAVLEEKLVQVETCEHEEKDEAEATHSDDGQTEKFDNPAVTKVCEENSSEKVSESSSVKLNEQVTSILTKDKDEEKKQEVTVVEKDQGEDSVTSAQDVPFEGCLEETNHDSEGIEPEVVDAKGSVEEDTREIKSSDETLEEKEQIVNPTDVSITTQTKQEEETIENEEKNDEKAMMSDYGETKESQSPIVSEICEETVSHNTESVEGLKVSDTSSMATNQHEISSKDETRAQVQDPKEDDVTFSQAATSIEDLHVENKENIINEEKNVEEAIEKKPYEDMGPENVESDAGLKVSDSMEPSVKEAFSTEEKDQGDTDGVPRSQDATCEDVKETTPTIVGDFKELSETPREFIKEETEDKTIDAQETNDDYENKAEDKVLERPDESVKEIEKEEEIEEIRPSVEVEEELEKNELLQGVTTDASISTQTEPHDEITEPDNKDEEEASQSEDGKKETYDNSSINEVCEEISSEKVEYESSGVKLNEIETSIVNKDEDEEKEQELIVLEKDKAEDRVTSEQNVPSEGCLEEENHDSEGIEPEIVEAKGSTGKVTEEIRSSVETPEEGTPETERKNDEEAIKSDDGQTKEYGIIVNEICDETVSHNTESAEGLKVSHTSSKENEHELASKDETEEKEQIQEEEDVTVSQTATSIEYLQAENSDTTIKEEDNEKEACDDLSTDIVESGVGLKTSDSIELSGKEAPSTVEKEQDDTDGVPSSQDAASEDIKETTPTIVSDFKELNEMPREIIKEKTEDKTIDAQEENDDCENKADERLVEQPNESVKETEQEEEIEEIRPSVEIKEKLEQNESLHGVTTDASISTQTKSQDEITQPEDKDEEEATQSDDGQKEKNDNSLTNEVCEEISPEKVESEISIIDVNEKEASFLSNDGDDEKEQEVVVLEKDQGEDSVTSAKDVPSEALLEETSHDNEGIESEAKNAQGSVEDDTKEIGSGVDTPEGATENKEKDDEEAIKSEESQTKESGIPIVDEICEETVSHNVESEEGLKVSDISSKETNEHELASKDETEEKEQDHVADDVTCSQDAISTDLQENKNESTKKEDKNDEVTIEKVASEETNAENAESEVGLKHSDDMEPSKKESLETIEKGQGITNGVTSSQDATIVDESKELNEEERPREFFKEETEDKLTDAQEAKEKSENGAEDHIEQKPEESVKKIEQEEEKTEETNPRVEIEEQNESLCDVTSDDSSISTQTKPQAETIEHEEKNEEVATQSDDSQNEKSDKPSIKEVCEEEKSETVGYETSTPITVLNKDEDQELDQAVNMLEKDEGEDDVTSAQNATPTDVCISKQTILEKESTENEEKNAEEVVESDDSQTKKSGSPEEKEVCEETVSEKDIKVEDQETEQELDISEKSQSGREDLTSSQNAANEDIKETTIAQHVTAFSYSEEGPRLSAIPTEILKEETEEKSIDAQEASEYEDREMPKEIVNEISSKNEQEVHIEEIKPSEEKDVCISTPTEAQEEATQTEEKEFHNTVSEEVIDLSNSSDVNQNEKGISILSKDEVQETEQELKISDKDQEKDEVTCSQDAAAVSEVDLPGKCEDEGDEQKFVEIRESTKEDNDVIRTSVEPEERVEQQIESLERTTEQEACEEIVKEVCEETSSAKIEYVEAPNLSHNSEIKVIEKAMTPSKDEGKGETTETEEKNDDDVIKNEDVISSQNESNEDIQETNIGQNATTVANIEEVQDLSAMTKEVLQEEAEDKSVDAQQVDSCSEVVKENSKEDETDSGNNKEEVLFEKQNNEAGKADDGIECETQKIVAENKDEATGDVSKSAEGILTDVETSYEEAGSPLAAETEDATLNKKDDQYIETEKMSLEVGHPKEEEILACPTETISEKTEDGITGKNEDLSHDSIKDNENNTKEEQCVVDGRTREIEISTLEHKTIEEQIGGIGDVSKENSIDTKETTDVEPQEDIMPSSFLETSTEDASNSDKTKSEREDLPVENVESVSEVQNPEVVPESKDLKLKEESVNSTTTSYVEEEKEIVMEEIASNEKTEQPVEIKKEGVEEEPDESITEKTEAEEGVNDEKSTVETNENTEQHGLLHVITTDVCSSAETKPNEETVKDEEKNDELGQTEVQIVEEILEKKEDDTTTEKEDLSHDSTEDTVLDESTRDIEPQEDITPSSSSEILTTTHTSISECENLPTEELKSVLQVQIAEVEPKTEEPNLKEECIISATETHVDAEQVTVTKEISSDQILEPCGEKKLTHESTTNDHNEETILQQEESDIASEKNQSVYEKDDLDEEATQANQFTSAEDCSERVKDVVLTKELSYSDPIPDGNHEVTEVIVDGQIGQEGIPAAEDISCESTLEDDNVDKVPKEEKNSSIKGAATIESQADSSNIESTACPSESETPPTQSLESVSEVLEGSEDSKVKENCIMLATAENTNNVEEEKIISNCISSAPDTKEDNVKQAHLKSEGELSRDFTTEEKGLTEEVDAESQTESGDIQAVEDLSRLSKASYTIKEGATEDTENTPNLDLEKEKKANELISEVQTPETLPKMGIKCEHPEATNEKCETLTGGESNEKLLDADVEIDTKKDIEVIAKAEEKAIEESNQDAVAEVTVHEHLQQTEEVLLEDEKPKESKIIEDNIDEEASCIQDSTEATLDPKRMVEKPTEVCEFTSEAAEIVTESTEASPKILLVKHDSDIATANEKNEDEIKEKDTILQAPNLSSESGEGKQNSIGDLLNKEGEVVQPQGHIFNTKSDVEIKEEVELTQSGSQQTSVDKKTEDSPVLLSEEKEQSEEASVKDAQKDVDHTAKVAIVDVVNADCSDIKPQYLSTEEATLPSVNHENQTEHKKEADKNIDATIRIEDVKSSDVELQSDMDVPVPNCTSTKLEVRSVDLEVPSSVDATDEKMNLGSTCDKGKTTEEVSGIKQEPLELDTPVNTVATEDLDISHKGVTGDVIKISQTETEIPKNEISAKPPQNESIESKISAQNVDASHAQGEPTAKLSIPEPEDLKAIKAPGSEPQRSSEVTKEGGKMSDVEVKSESAAPTKEEIADSGVKTDEENEEQEDNEDNENSGECSETPVMVEASKDMEVKVHKKSHNILSGVGSKVKHSIAKVKKAITGGKSSSPKPPSPKERD